MLDRRYSVICGFYARYSNSSLGERLRGRCDVPYWLDSESLGDGRHSFKELEVSVRLDNSGGESFLFISLNGEELTAILEIFVTHEKFRELAESWDKTEITFDFKLLNEKWQFEGDSFISKISFLEIERAVYSSVFPVAHRYSEKLLGKWVLCPESRLGRIGLELVNSLENWYAQNPREQSHGLNFKVVEDFLSSLRCTANTDAAFTSLLWKTPSEFSSAIKDFPQDQLARAKQAYDTVWQHTNVSNLINGGKLHDNVHQEISSESLEQIAQSYISNPRLSSPLLEWLLLDALLFNETISFARFIPNLPNNRPSKVFWNSLWQTSKFLGWEGLALMLTGIVAASIDASKEIGFWTIMATVTLIRWLRPTKMLANQRQVELLKLLSDMASIHERLKHYAQFNARLIRDLLYDVEKRGAVFSPWAYHIIDKRITREKHEIAQ
jgi:hypothetical protein